MKKLVLAALMLAGGGAQGQIIGRSIKAYTTKLGTVLHVGDTIIFGRGQRESGAFKYAAIAAQPFHQTEESLPATWNNRKAVVSQLREMPYKTGAVVTTVFKVGAFNGSLNADVAEELGEILTPAGQQKATPAASGGVADELLKLKKLLDAGALTQDEFDAQKAKLLAR